MNVDEEKKKLDNMVKLMSYALRVGLMMAANADKDTKDLGISFSQDEIDRTINAILGMAKE